MNTNDIKFSIIGILTAIFAPIIYQYYAYVKLATIGLGALAIGLIAVGLVGGVGYGVAVAWLKIQAKRAEVDLAKADVAYRRAEADKMYYHPLTLNDGQHALMVDMRHPMNMQTYSTPPAKTIIAADLVKQLAAPVDEAEADIMATVRTGGKWIEDFLFDEDDKLISPHYSVNGPTGVGKTHLVLYIMSLIQQPYPRAEYWLLDPKFEGKKSGWPFVPFVEDFEEMAAGAQYVYDNVVTKRKHNNRNDIEPDFPAFVIVDEVDGSADDHGDKFVKPLRKGIKEGRSGLTYYFIVGQSSLIKENKLSGAIFRNTTRFIMGNEALAFTRNAQFTFWDKAARELIAKQLINLQSQGRRSVLVVPMDGQGLPFVGEIPHLPKPSFSQAADVEEASQLLLDANTMTYGEAKVVDDNVVKAMVTAYEGGKSVTEVARLKYSSEGTKQNVLTLRILEKAGVKLRSDDVAILAKGRW